MYKGNLALQTGRELLTVSLDIEKNMHEVMLSPLLGFASSIENTFEFLRWLCDFCIQCPTVSHEVMALLAGLVAVLGPARHRRRRRRSFRQQAVAREGVEQGQDPQAVPWDVARAHG